MMKQCWRPKKIVQKISHKIYDTEKAIHLWHWLSFDNVQLGMLDDLQLTSGYRSGLSSTNNTKKTGIQK